MSDSFSVSVVAFQCLLCWTDVLCDLEAYSKDIDEELEKKLDFSIKPYQYEPVEGNGEEESEDETSSVNTELDI